MSRFVHRRSVGIVVLVIAAAAIAFPLGVLASHQFVDVPNSNPFHNDIDAIADAGVTLGCGGGKYCPSDFVTREQMAAFMNRLGALQAGKTPVVNATKVDGLDSTQFARSDVVVTGHANCMGIGMQPWASGMSYSADADGRFLTAGSGFFNCPIVMPDGATITALRAGVLDNNATGQAVCYLLAIPPDFGPGGYSPAFTPYSGEEEQPGIIVLEDTSITQPTVDNETYSYLAECELSAPSSGMSELALRGVSVEYTISGLPVP